MRSKYIQVELNSIRDLCNKHHPSGFVHFTTFRIFCPCILSLLQILLCLFNCCKLWICLSQAPWTQLSSSNNCVDSAWINFKHEILHIIHVETHAFVNLGNQGLAKMMITGTCWYNSSIWSYNIGCKCGKRANSACSLQLCTERDWNTFEWN